MEMLLEESTCQLAKAAGVPLHRFPETPQEADLIEGLLAQAMDKLSMDQHEKIIFDIHGFVETEEDPAALEQSLKDMDNELLLIEPKEKEAYLLAHSLDPTYVSSRSVRLLFLRYQRYNSKMAAQTMVQHFEAKRELFGSGDVLARPVRQSDLSSKDLSAVGSGLFQVLPNRDAAGRAVFLYVTPPSCKGSRMLDFICNQRAFWYVAMKALDDESIQINGVVWISIMRTDGMKVSAEEYHTLQHLEAVVPFRAVVGHVCYSDPELRPYVAGFQLFAHEEERHRIRVHFGPWDQIIFELQTFGIPFSRGYLAGLAENDGTNDALRTEYLQWLALLKDQEDRESILSSTDILIPHRLDVLFGKTSMARQHPGTLRALHLVETHYQSYERLEKLEKAQLAEKILKDIQSDGCRFLRQDGGVWVKVSDEDARKKIAHWFRHARYKRRSSSTSMNGEEDSNQREETTDSVLVPSTKRLSPSSLAYGGEDDSDRESPVPKKQICKQVPNH